MLEERLVAAHRVDDERSVRFDRLSLEAIGVIKLHVDVRCAQSEARHFHLKAQIEALFRRDLDDEAIGCFAAESRNFAEEIRRGWLELDDDLGLLRRELLARTNVERRARPTPVVEVHFDRGVGFGH